jgi:hypothetical protein
MNRVPSRRRGSSGTLETPAGCPGAAFRLGLVYGVKVCVVAAWFQSDELGPGVVRRVAEDADLVRAIA